MRRKQESKAVVGQIVLSPSKSLRIFYKSFASWLVVQ